MVDALRIENAYRDFIAADTFPCVAAKLAGKKDNIHVMVAGHMGCPFHDRQIHDFAGKFIKAFRESIEIYHSAAVIFPYPVSSEEEYETFLWQRLQALAELDACTYDYAPDVSSDPNANDFSFSLHEEALFVIGMHPFNERPARRFQFPVIVFNPHRSFQHLRKKGGYEKMKSLVRKHDLEQNGSVNIMLSDFGERSEVYQYSGRVYDNEWRCPLQINHGK